MSLRITDRYTARCVVGDEVRIAIRDLRDQNDNVYDLSGASKIYCMVKASLSDEDSAALININSVANPTQFDLSDASNGNLTIILSSSNTSNLSPGVQYFLDVKAIWESGGPISIVNEPEFVLIGQVTRATS